MKRLNLKLTLAILFSFFVATLIPRLLMRWFNVSVPTEFVDSPIFLIGGLVSAFIALSLFAFLSTRILMRRIHALQAATRRVQSGVYDVFIQDQGNDELSSLISTFNDMQQTLESNQYLNQEFVRNVSHQFKTPLSVISSLVQTLDLPESQEPYRERLLEEIDQLASLTGTLLTLSKVESFEYLSVQSFDLSEMIRRLIISKQPLWEVKECEWEVSDASVTCHSYAPYVQEMVSNILDNMIQYAPNKSTLTVSIIEQAQSIILEFTNQGPAISEEDQEHMFDLFYKGSHSSGSGVGLHLVKSILTRLKGEISVTSNPTSTTFKVVLPHHSSLT
ncbi:MAG: HAMP domain-containing histidine kinase [Erysipelothrix sp.]|jgi:signal transduction histidine kinase|nr:HAMP domain-containing histidine kinase [Erysipelothrix sp.]